MKEVLLLIYMNYIFYMQPNIIPLHSVWTKLAKMLGESRWKWAKKKTNKCKTYN